MKNSNNNNLYEIYNFDLLFLNYFKEMKNKVNEKSLFGKDEFFIKIIFK